MSSGDGELNFLKKSKVPVFPRDVFLTPKNLIQISTTTELCYFCICLR